MPLCSRVKISLEYRVDLFEGSIRFELHYVYQITLAFGIFIVYLPDILNTRDGLTVWELSLTVFVFVAIDRGRLCRLLPGLDGAGHILCRRCQSLPPRFPGEAAPCERVLRTKWELWEPFFPFADIVR
jgi:hypothetical protein